MLRVVFRVIWILLSIWLLIWVAEGLFGVDQSASLLPGDPEGLTAPIMVGVAWGLLMTFSGIVSGGRTRRVPTSGSVLGVGRVIEVSRTGVSINDVPQYDVFLRITPQEGSDIVGQLRTLAPPEEMAHLQPGAPLAVYVDPQRPESVVLADPSQPEVRRALLEWRHAKGLIDARQLQARTTGVQVPAAVLEVRPTGTRREGQSELALRVLLSPEGQSSWEAETTVFVYPEAVSRLQVGSPIWAFYRREDPQTVAITIEREEGR